MQTLMDLSQLGPCTSLLLRHWQLPHYESIHVRACCWVPASSFAGKLNYQQLLQLVPDSTKDTVPQGLSKLLLARRPGDARRLVDVLQE